jgi:hypothetical protein
MVETVRAALGRNASFKLSVILLLIALVPCYVVGGLLLSIGNARNAGQTPTPATQNTTPPRTQVAGLPTPLPSITAISGRPTERPTERSRLAPTPTDLFLDSPPPYATFDTRTLFPEQPTPLAMGTPDTIRVGVPYSECRDEAGTTATVIRTSVSPDSAPGASIFCRAVADPGRIGNEAVLQRGVVVAVDITAWGSGGQVTRFQRPIQVCLLGEGVFLFLDANTAPRSVTQLPAVPTGDYLCADIPNAGTVVLTYR